MIKLLTWQQAHDQPQKRPLSKTAQILLQNNGGWRNDLLFSSDDYTITDCLNYENNELGNEDVVDFIQQLPGKDNRSLTDMDMAIAAVETFISQQHLNNLYGWWLTTKAACQEIYQDEPDEPLSQYQLPQAVWSKTLILSDLSTDGLLIATPDSHAAYHIN